MWFESTFVLSMLEPWEKVLLCRFTYALSRKTPANLNSTYHLVTILGVFCLLVISGLFKYLPHHLNVMQRRAVYYLWGQEGDPRVLWQLGKDASDGVRRLLKEL